MRHGAALHTDEGVPVHWVSSVEVASTGERRANPGRAEVRLEVITEAEHRTAANGGGHRTERSSSRRRDLPVDLASLTLRQRTAFPVVGEVHGHLIVDLMIPALSLFEAEGAVEPVLGFLGEGPVADYAKLQREQVPAAIVLGHESVLTEEVPAVRMLAGCWCLKVIRFRRVDGLAQGKAAPECASFGAIASDEALEGRRLFGASDIGDAETVGVVPVRAAHDVVFDGERKCARFALSVSSAGKANGANQERERELKGKAEHAWDTSRPVPTTRGKGSLSGRFAFGVCNGDLCRGPKCCCAAIGLPNPHGAGGEITANQGTMYEQSQLRALINTAVDGVLSINSQGTVGLYNPAAERIFGHPAESVIGQPVEQLMPQHHAVAHSTYINRYIEGGHAKIIGIGRQVEGVKADGTVFPIHLSVGEFEDNGERHFVGILRDLTREVAARQRAQDLQSQLDLIARHAAVSEMGAALAHELNQPLTAIDLFLVAAERQLESDPSKAKQLFERVRTEAERAGGIVRRIRQMVERSDGEKALFPLALAVQEAVELCNIVGRQGLSLEVGSLPLERVFADQTQFRMVMVNLINNALDAVTGQKDGGVIVRGHLAKMATIEVLDNGPGVAGDFEAQLFQPFASTKTRGLGIGLSICRTIAESHGGRLTYVRPSEQQDGLGGAMFRLELPWDEQTP